MIPEAIAFSLIAGVDPKVGICLFRDRAFLLKPLLNTPIASLEQVLDEHWLP